MDRSMAELDVASGFDLHEYREGFKLLKQDRQTTAVANRADYACPACDEVFDRLFVSEKRTNTFGDPGGPFCILRTDEEQLLLFTH